MRVQLVGEREDVYLDLETEDLPFGIIHAGRAYMQGSMQSTRSCYFPVYAYFSEDGTYDRPE